MLGLRISGNDANGRYFTTFSEAVSAEPFHQGDPQITMSLEQAQELCDWLTVQVYGIEIRKAESATVRREPCAYCGRMVTEWSDPEGGRGRCCPACEVIAEAEIAERKAEE